MKSIGKNDPNTILKSLDFWRWASRKSCFCIYQPGFLLCSIMYHIVPLYPLSFLAVSVIKLQPIHPFREKQPKTQKVRIGEKSPNISRILMLLIHRCCSNLPFLDQIPTTFPHFCFSTSIFSGFETPIAAPSLRHCHGDLHRLRDNSWWDWWDWYWITVPPTHCAAFMTRITAILWKMKTSWPWKSPFWVETHLNSSSKPYLAGSMLICWKVLNSINDDGIDNWWLCDDN